jgi:fatty acid desaturase/nitrite reductase/ring-hydroxylating ferredoxin subunit
MNQPLDYTEISQHWYQCDISRQEIKELMQRSDYKGLTRTIAFFAVLIALGWAAYFSIGHWWMIPTFFLYGTVYCFLNHLMHETHHRTVFKSLWLNESIHWISAFCHGAEPIYDRWGHAQHHSYTYIIGHDPEVATARPADIPLLLGTFFGIGIIHPWPIILHALGVIPQADRELVPESDWKAMIWSSRFWLLGYGLLIASCLCFHTLLPLVYTLFARFYGAFYPTMLNLTQHIGLEQNVYDHRLCTRNVKVDPVTSFIYWDMQYHIEHHMFPGVPFHALKKLHAKLKDQLPEPYTSVWSVYRELLPSIWRQQTNTDYHVTPEVPGLDPSLPRETKTAKPVKEETASSATSVGTQNWIPVPGALDLAVNDVMGFTHNQKQYAIYRLSDGYFASCNRCPHAGGILSNGIVINRQIECPSHQGRFDIRSGKATASPASGVMPCYVVKLEGNELLLEIKTD